MGVFNPCIYMCIKIAWKNHRDFPLIEFQKTQCNMCWWWSSVEWVTLLLQTCGSLQRSSAKSWDWITVFMGRVLIRLAALLMVADPSELCGTAGDLLISELAEFRSLSSTEVIRQLSSLSDVQFGRWLKKWQILFLLLTIVIADSHIKIEQTWLLCNLPSDEHITNSLYLHSLCTKHGNLK